MPFSVTSEHPDFSVFKPDWELMRDTYKGERQVKTKSTKYLPFTSSQLEDGAGNGANQPGQLAYNAYKMRARFPNFTREAIQMAVGMMHSQPPIIKLPEAMERIRSNKNETMDVFLRRINTQQLIAGRVGILADMPKNPTPDTDFPYITLYEAERMINWDNGDQIDHTPESLNLVVLDETKNRRNDKFEWTLENQYRVLILGDLVQNEHSALYQMGIFKNETFDQARVMVPKWRGRTLDHIPFQFINSCDLAVDPDDPPLLDLANICMTIYRADADYRQNLFMQGQDTFVTIGSGFDEEEKVRVGAGARVDLPMGADAKYVGVESSGLEEQRAALENLERRGGSMGAQTLDTTSRERESGDSLRIRVAARTADMNQIAETGAEALEKILKSIATWVNEDPEEVEVKPNKEFGEIPLTGQTMVEMATARNLGYPISAQTLHEIAVKRRVTTKTFDEEMAAAQAEKDSIFKPALTGDMANKEEQNKNA
jgi:hypothetical protein